LHINPSPNISCPFPRFPLKFCGLSPNLYVFALLMCDMKLDCILDTSNVSLIILRRNPYDLFIVLLQIWYWPMVYHLSYCQSKHFPNFSFCKAKVAYLHPPFHRAHALNLNNIYQQTRKLQTSGNSESNSWW